AFVRISNTFGLSSHPNAGTTDAIQADDLGVRCWLSDRNKLTCARASVSDDVDTRVVVRIWRYTGPDGGPNQFINRGTFSALRATGGTGTVLSSAVAVADINKTTAIDCGATMERDGVTNFDRMRFTHQMVSSSGSKVQVVRADAGS